MRVTRSLMARAGAVAAAAAIMVAGAASVADAAAATHAKVHPKTATTLTIRNSKPVARKHVTTARVGGRLTAKKDHAPVRRAWVWLQRKAAKDHWITVAARRTNRKGEVAFRVHIFKKAVSFRLVFRGNKHFKHSVSRVDRIAPAR